MSLRKPSKDQPKNFEFNQASLEAAKIIVSKYAHALQLQNDRGTIPTHKPWPFKSSSSDRFPTLSKKITNTPNDK